MATVADRAAAAASLIPTSQQSTLAGKLRRFGQFPLLSLAGRLTALRWLHTLRTAIANRTLKRLGLAHLLDDVAAEAFDQDPADLLFLYRQVRNLRPDRSLELGSGCTTIFMAQALYENGGGHLWSVDDNAHWLELAERALPPHLRPFVTYRHCPPRVHSRYGIATSEYTALPREAWDFVLIDGPGPVDGVTISCDLIAVADEMKPGATGMVDHRWRSAVLAREHAGDQLRFRYSLSLESFLFRKRAH